MRFVQFYDAIRANWKDGGVVWEKTPTVMINAEHVDCVRACFEPLSLPECDVYTPSGVFRVFGSVDKVLAAIGVERLE